MNALIDEYSDAIADRAALAEWQSASHIKRAPQHKKEKPPAAES